MTYEFSHTKNGEPQYDLRAESSWDAETFARYVEHCEKLGYFERWKHEDGSQMTPEEVYEEIMQPHIPAWSLHRLWEIAAISEVGLGAVSEIAKLYDLVIDNIECQIVRGSIDKEYLEDK